MEKNKLISGIAIGIISTVAAGFILNFIRKSRMEKRLVSVADAGYETAHDILFPLKGQRLKKS